MKTYKRVGENAAPPPRSNGWRGLVVAAAVEFEARWSYAALRRVDHNLYNLFMEQRELWHAALRGEGEEDEHGPAMLRAYDVLTARMDALPDSAYLIGQCPRTGFRIAIGQTNAPATRLDGVVYLTADEVATLLAETDFDPIAQVKTVFPGATVEEVRDATPF